MCRREVMAKFRESMMEKTSEFLVVLTTGNVNENGNRRKYIIKFG